MFRPLTCAVIVGLATVVLSEAAPKPMEPAERLAQLKAQAATGQQGVPALLAALKDPQAQVRVAALELLASLEGRAAIPEIAPLVLDRENAVAVRAVGALFELGGDQTTAPLKTAFHSPSARVRTETASLAGDARASRFIADLGALLSDELPGVRRTAVEALRAIGDPATLPFLMAATGDGKAAIAASAIAGLDNLKDPRALARIAPLSGALSPEVRAAVAHAIPALRGLTTYAALFLQLAQDPDKGVRLAAATGLRDAATQEAGPGLALLVADPDPGVRRLAVQALREQKGPVATAALAVVLNDPDENVRASAVLALGRRAATDQAGRVAAFALDPSERVRAAVASTLGDFGRVEDLAALQALAADPVANVRAAAVVAAARIGTAAALPIVSTGTKDAEPLVRLETVRALGLLDQPEALARLRELATAGDLASRIAAIDQLGARKDRGAIALLRKLARDPVETLRSAARRALETIGA